MTPEQFVKEYVDDAKRSQVTTGLHYLIPMTQGAAESGWGKKAPGFNFFGIKASKNTPPEKKQLVTTTEYLKSANVKFPKVHSVVKQPNGLYKYKVDDWFMKFASAEEAFKYHGNFFVVNPRYAKALLVKDNPERFFEEIAKAGYATAPTYAADLKAVMRSVIRRLPK